MTFDLSPETSLETPRLILKLLETTSIPQAIEYYKRNRDFFTPSMADYPPDFLTEFYQTESFWKEFQLFADGEAIRFYFFYKNDFFYKKIVGDISLSNIVRGPFQSCKLGCRIDEEEARKGLMSEALTETIRFVFEDLRLHRIEADILTSNTSSINLVLKHGFVEEGIVQGFMLLNGKWENHKRFALLSDM